MYYYSLFTVFVIIITMMILDPNVSDYIYLLGKLLKSKVERLYWVMRFHPVVFSSPIGRWWTMRKYMKEVESLRKELSKEN